METLELEIKTNGTILDNGSEIETQITAKYDMNLNDDYNYEPVHWPAVKCFVGGKEIKEYDFQLPNMIIQMLFNQEADSIIEDKIADIRGY